VFIVKLSVLDEPVSSAAAMSGVPGVVGAVVSIVNDNPADVVKFPAISYNVAVTVCDPAAKSASEGP
jgi:hypothetical protein